MCWLAINRPAAMVYLAHWCHGIRLVEQDEFERGAGIAGNPAAHRPRCKALDLVAHNTDTALVTGVQLHHTCLDKIWPVPQRQQVNQKDLEVSW